MIFFLLIDNRKNLNKKLDMIVKQEITREEVLGEDTTMEVDSTTPDVTPNPSPMKNTDVNQCNARMKRSSSNRVGVQTSKGVSKKAKTSVVSNNNKAAKILAIKKRAKEVLEHDGYVKIDSQQTTRKLTDEIAELKKQLAAVTQGIECYNNIFMEGGLLAFILKGSTMVKKNVVNSSNFDTFNKTVNNNVSVQHNYSLV